MQHAVLSAFVAAIVAAIVSVVSFRIAAPGAAPENTDIDALATRLASHKLLVEKFTPPVLTYSSAPSEDGWIDGARGAGADHRSLAPASNSVCFLTKVEIKGIQSPQDSNRCSIDIDDFTGYWQLSAAVDEGGKSQVRCNARCLIWK